MFCKYCGKNIPDSADFCSECGKSTKEYKELINAVNPETLKEPSRAKYSAASAQSNINTNNSQQPSYPNSGYKTYTPPYGYDKPKKKGKRVFAVIVFILFFLVGWYAIGDITHNNGISHGNHNGNGIYSQDLGTSDLRNFYVNTSDAQDVTLMVYMVGSDLESYNGCATDDLSEMADAKTGDNLNIVIKTGGTQYWNNTLMSDEKAEIWHLADGEFELIKNCGTENMLTADSLSDFIGYCKNSYPADRYILIFWDHGGGPVYGFGYDEIYPNDVLTLVEIDSALSSSNIKFDIIGFDACLMANVETAYMLKDHADYLIASEETEPGGGWFYTDWLKKLENNPDMGSIDLGVQIIDDYIAHSSDSETLSLISLREIDRVYTELCEYMAELNDDMLYDNFSVISNARADAKAYAEGEYDLIDIVDFTDEIGVLESEDLVNAILSAVKYRNDCSIKGSYGLSMYFPYSDLSSYSAAKYYIDQFGFSGDCYKFFDNFVNIMAGGKIETENYFPGGLTLEGPASSDDYESYDWYNDEITENYDYSYTLDVDNTELVDEDYVLYLSDEDWEHITDIRVEAMLDDSEGYIDLGIDQYFELDGNDNLYLTFDNTWVSLNNQVVAYYAESTLLRYDNTYVFTGYVPAILNEELYIEIMLKYDEENPYGYVEGYRTVSENTQTAPKAYLQFKEGDQIDFVCNYYTYEGDYDDWYLFGDTMIYGKEGFDVGYTDVGEDPVLVCYRITDIYQNTYWTDYLYFSY